MTGMFGPVPILQQRGGAIALPLYFYERNDLFMSYKPLENVTIVFSTANITVCADEWGDLYYTTEIPDEFVNQGEPYPRSKCKPIIDLPPEQFDRVLAIYKELPDDLLEHLIRGEEQEDA